MSEARAQFLKAYDEKRVKDQQRFYELRTKEYERSARQVGVVNGTFLFLAAVCGAAGAVFIDQSTWLGLTAAGLSGAAAATTSWGDVIGFSANAQLYKAASASLANLRPGRPRDAANAKDAEVETYLGHVEDVLMGEVRTWGERSGKELKKLGQEPRPPDRD